MKLEGVRGFLWISWGQSTTYFVLDILHTYGRLVPGQLYHIHVTTRGR